MRAWILVLIGSLLVGSALGAAAPATWTFRWTDGLLLGLALYVAALRRYVDRHEAEAMRDGGETATAASGLVLTMLPGLLLRTVLFAAIASLQATLCFDVVPYADVRRGFVILSAWVVMLALIDTGPTHGSLARATEASRPPFR